jgi:hypothetical protein
VSEQAASAILRALLAREFCQFCFEFFEQREVNVAIEFNEISKQHERTLHALDQWQFRNFDRPHGCCLALCWPNIACRHGPRHMPFAAPSPGMTKIPPRSLEGGILRRRNDGLQ